MINFKYYVAKALKIFLRPPALNKCIIDRTSKVCSGSELSSVCIGKYSYIGNNSFLVNTQLGNYCSVADKCSIGGAMHPIDRVSSSPVFHEGRNILKKNFSNLPFLDTPKTIIENDVWIGMGVYIKAGTTIHTGAVIGMGSVVTKDVPAYEIWAGNPAKKIRDRFDERTKERLLDSQWWDLPDDKIQLYSEKFDDVEEFLDSISK